MAGIEDVQPKGITIPQMIGENPPAVTLTAMDQLLDAYHKGFIRTNDIMEHPGGNALARGLAERSKIEAERQLLDEQRSPEMAALRKKKLESDLMMLGEQTSSESVAARKKKLESELMLLSEQSSPESVAARYEAQRLVGEKARGERETALSKDFVGAYLKYNLPLKNVDGTPDYSGMAEVGQKYADAERQLAYAKMGLTGTPTKRLDPKTNREFMVTLNAFGEDITQPGEGLKNPVLEHYQKLIRKNSTYLLQNNDEPSGPEGAEEPQIQVSPKAIVDEPAAPMIERITSPTLADEIQRATETPARKLFSPAGNLVEVQPAGRPITPLVAIAQPLPIPGMPTATGKYRMPVIEPTTPPPAAVVIAPAGVPPAYVPGTGVLTSKAEFKIDPRVEAARKSEFYANWAQKSAPIQTFRAQVVVYAADPENENTGQTDKALLLAANQIASTSASGGGGRGLMNEVKLVEANIPMWDRIKDSPDLVLKRKLFPEGVRKRLIAETERQVESLESLARGVMGPVRDQLKAEGTDLTPQLYDAEKALFGPTTGAQEAGAAPTLYRTTIIGGRTFRVKQ